VTVYWSGFNADGVVFVGPVSLIGKLLSVLCVSLRPLRYAAHLTRRPQRYAENAEGKLPEFKPSQHLMYCKICGMTLIYARIRKPLPSFFHL
jgi:hypothetical protein